MKKFLKIGCLSIAVLLLLIIVISVFANSNSIETTDIESKVKEEIVEEKIVKPIMTDSIWKTIVKNNFRENSDPFKGTSFYEHKLTPKYINTNWAYPYIGKSGSDFFLRFKMQYEADDWLFIDRVQFLIDGTPVDFATGDFKRDNDGGRIWEWGDIQLDAASTIILQRIADSKKTLVRYTGNQYHKDRAITSNEKKVIEETLEAFLKSKEYR